MKKLIKPILGLLLFLPTTFISCKKESSPVVNTTKPTVDECRLTQMKGTTPGGAQEFNLTYDAQKRLVEKATIRATTTITKYTYNVSNLIETIQVYRNDTLLSFKEYSYEEGKLKIENTYSIKNGIKEEVFLKNKYIYDNDKLVKKNTYVIRTISMSEQLSEYTDYVMDGNGCIISAINYYMDTDTTSKKVISTTYTYGKDISSKGLASIFFSIEHWSAKYLPLTTIDEYDPNVKKINTFSYENKNSKGYPTIINLNTPDGNFSNTLSYNCD